MNLVVIRGLPGTGKTTVSKILGSIIPDSHIIHVDEFKIEAMNKGNSFEEAKEISYEKAIESLENSKSEYVILEEILCEEVFFRRLLNFCSERNSNLFCLRLMRPLNKLLELESERKRKVKNTKEDFFNLKQDLERIKINGEFWIKNDNLPLVIKGILNLLF